ncbi:EF-hand domain pair containing protein [Tanacetum coccineum]
MTKFGGLYFFLTVLVIISSVKGRWLETSDGVHDINDMNQKNDSFLSMSVSDLNPKTLYASEKRCESIYGFLPCADTVPEGIFLILMYTYALMLGEECLKKGSAALLIHFRKQDIAGSVFRVLMALPRVVMVIVSGVLSTESDARNQVAFGFAMYAGSTVISLTGLWGVYVVLNTEKLTKPSNPASSKLSNFKDVGVKIDNDTCNMASILLLSLIPFAVVLLLLVFNNRIIVLIALIVSVLSFCYYIRYQLCYLKRSELENFIRDTFDNEEEHIFRQYALDEILRHFDKDSTQSLTMTEFEEGCTSWLNKWSVANKGLGTELERFLLFSHDVNKDDEMNYEELEKAIVELKITEQDAGAFAKSMIAALDTNKSGTLSKEEVITGLKKLTEMANTTASGHNDLVTLFQRYVCEMMGLVNDKEGFDWNILYILLGAGTLYLFAEPFMQSVIQFSSALQIPFLFTSFVVAPFFMNARSMSGLREDPPTKTKPYLWLAIVENQQTKPKKEESTMILHTISIPQLPTDRKTLIRAAQTSRNCTNVERKGTTGMRLSISTIRENSLPKQRRANEEKDGPQGQPSRLSKELQCAVTFFPEFCIMQDLYSRTLIGAGDCEDGLYKMGMFENNRAMLMILHKSIGTKD